MKNTLKILFFGDINGEIGRKAIASALPKLKKKFKPDVIIANAENLAHGLGITEKTINEMLEVGINYFTSGNHIFDKVAAEAILNQHNCPIIRPANYLGDVAGSGEKIIDIGQNRLLMINLMGRVFIEEKFNNPFTTADKILGQYKNEKLNGIIVDFHAEATSEKIAMKHYLDGRVSAIWGTHTHVATADEQISKQGTAYITDVGMVGLADGVIGVDRDNVIKNFLSDEDVTEGFVMKTKGTAQINAIYLEINPQTQKAEKINQLYFFLTIE